jgi:hypothetical protein
MPLPLDLKKHSATTRSLVLSFREPSRPDSFTHYKISIEDNVSRLKKNINRFVRKDKLTATDAGGDKYFFLEIDSKDFLPGVKYMVTVQTMRNEGNRYFNSAYEMGTNRVQMRTLPEPITNLAITQTEMFARSMTVDFLGKATRSDMAMYNYFRIRLIEMDGEDQIQKEYLIIPHETKAVINWSPLPSQYTHTFENLNFGTQYLVQISTVSDNNYFKNNEEEASPAKMRELDITESEIREDFYTVSFDGPKNVTKLEFTQNSMTLGWEAIEMEGISQYQISYNKIMANGSIDEEESLTIPAEFIGGGEQETYTLENLEPGFMYTIYISSIREGFPNGNRSEPSLEYFQTMPAAPKPQDINITLVPELVSGLGLN